MLGEIRKACLPRNPGLPLRKRSVAKEMSALAKNECVEKTGDRAISVGEEKCKRLFKIQSVPEIYVNYFGILDIVESGDASWFARQFTNCMNRRASPLRENFYIRGISTTARFRAVSCCHFIRAREKSHGTTYAFPEKNVTSVL